ncbi:MAG: hypothetical protein QXV24_01180 [Nitrososphaerota archaeon]
MLSIIDYFYSPITWIIINVGILIGIILVVRATNKVKKMQEVLTMNRLFQEFLDALNKNVDMKQKELSSYYANAIINYLTSIGFSRIGQGQTFREFIESLKLYKFIHEEYLNNLINLYEYGRFSSEIIDGQDIEKLKLILLEIGKSAKSYVERRLRGELSGPSEDWDPEAHRKLSH